MKPLIRILAGLAFVFVLAAPAQAVITYELRTTCRSRVIYDNGV